jgi:hypothetical protein
MSASAGLARVFFHTVSQQPRPEGEPSKDTRLLQGFPAHGGRPVTTQQWGSSLGSGRHQGRREADLKCCGAREAVVGGVWMMR